MEQVFGVGHLEVLEVSLVRSETERRREGRSQHDLIIMLREHSAKERLQTECESLPYH